MAIDNIRIQKGLYQPAFKARLFDMTNTQIKSFDVFDVFEKKDEMAARGNPNTDIFIKDFISKEDGLAGFANSIKLAIKNPLFGEQEFTQELSHATNSPVKGEICSELWHMDLLTGLRTNNCKYLEDRALRGGIIDRIKTLIENKQYWDISPMKILDNLLENYNSHGFSEERIKDFRIVANKLNDELIRKGIGIVKK